jgi:hypothetical protein
LAKLKQICSDLPDALKMKQFAQKKLLFFLSAAVFVSVLAGTALVTYRAVSSAGRIPRMPRASLDEKDAEQSILSLTARSADFHPEDEERRLISMLEELHLAECDKEEQAPALSVKKRTENLKQALKRKAANNPTRFFALGDFLALRFHAALEALLLEKPTDKPRRSVALTRVILFGGAFYKQALKRSIITPDRKLTVSKALPEILFRYRWRLLGGVAPAQEFTAFEQKALLDFTVRFADKYKVKKRLDAARKLSKQDPLYDAASAEALIYLEAGQKKKALGVLEKKISQGTATETILLFKKALSAPP